MEFNQITILLACYNIIKRRYTIDPPVRSTNKKDYPATGFNKNVSKRSIGPFEGQLHGRIHGGFTASLIKIRQAVLRQSYPRILEHSSMEISFGSFIIAAYPHRCVNLQSAPVLR